MPLLIPRKGVKIFQEAKNHQYFLCLFANLEKSREMSYWQELY